MSLSQPIVMIQAVIVTTTVTTVTMRAARAETVAKTSSFIFAIVHYIKS